MRSPIAAAAIGCSLCWYGCGGSGSQITPTTPTNSGFRNLTISGTTLLTPGTTSQLSATIVSGSGRTTPSSVTWQTRDTSVATISTAGLLAGVTAGTTIVSASADGLLAQFVVTVQSPAGTSGSALTACASITAPGHYVLAQDLVGGSTCVAFVSVADVHLDCQGHSLSGLALNNVNGATVQGCTVTGRMALSNVTSVTLSHSTVQNDLAISNSSSVIVSDSTLLPLVNGVTINSGSGVQLLRDTVATTKAVYGVMLTDGTNNQVLQSTFTGGYTGGTTGADDAVILINETGDVIQGNTISDFYDTAVEGVDALSNTTIANNNATNLGFAGIGSFWCTGWTNNTVQGNHIANAPTLGYIDYQTSDTHCGTRYPPPTFTGNQFIGNVFRDRTPNTTGPSLQISMTGSVSGNLIQGNDFGTYDGPHLLPLDGFIDGGGNICGPANPPAANFPCSGGGS